MVTARRQTRYVSAFEILNHCLNVLLIGATAAIAIGLWLHGQIGLGAVAAAIRHGAAPERHLALDHVGAGRPVREHRHRAGRDQHGDAADRRRLMHRRRVPLRVTRGEIRFEHVGLPLRRRHQGHQRPLAHHPPRREDRPGGQVRRGQVHAGQPAAAFLRGGVRAHPDRRPGHRAGDAGKRARADRHGDAGHLAAAPLGAREHPLRPARRRARRTCTPPAGARAPRSSSSTWATGAAAAATTPWWASVA